MTQEKSNLETHAENEMRLAGLYDKDSDYGGMIPDAVMKMVRAHSEEGHSGGSHSLVMAIFNKVINFQNLTPITNDPQEWMDVADYAGPQNPAVWQSRRNPSLFSNDSGKTYYSIDDEKRELKTAVEKK